MRDSIAEKHRVSAQDLVDKLIDQGAAAKHFPEFNEIIEHLQTHARDGDLIIIMGAGPVTSIAHALVDKLETNQLV